MRILYVITPSRLSGAERMLLRMARVQRRHGDSVRVLSKPLDAFERAAADDGIEMVTGAIGGKLNLRACPTIVEHIQRFAPDVVLTMHSTGTLWGVRAARKAGVPCVALMQAANTRWPYTTAPAAVGCAEFVRQHLIAGGMSPDRVYAIPNGIEPEPYLDDEDRDQARSDLGLTPSDLAVGTLAHFTPRKAHSDLLDAAAIVTRSVPELVLLWAGEGPLETKLRQQAARLGLADRVRFLGYRTDAPRLHRAFDIFALPSLLEGLPLAVLEAMASARPCVVTAVSGNPELVDDGVTGCLVPPRDPEAMAQALIRLATNDEARRTMGLAGRKRIMEMFTLDGLMQRLCEVLEREIRRQRGPGG